MKLEVVTIGTELVLGLTPDTNAAELGRVLAAAGRIASGHSADDREHRISGRDRPGWQRVGRLPRG